MPKSCKTGLVFLSLLLIFQYSYLFSEEVSEEIIEPEEEILVLEDITVTGLRVQKRLKDVPVFTEIISSEEIKRSNAVTISDVLENHGLMHTNNAMGDYITIQGMGSNRVLFLVDGRRIPGRVAQRINGATLPIGDVRRIEIVRGAQSALYGSDGIGGVVNIITKPPSEEPGLNIRVTNTMLSAHDNPGLLEDASPFREQTILASGTFPAGPFRNRVTIEGGRGEFYLNDTGSRSILPEYLRGKAGFESGVSIGDIHDLRFGGSLMSMRTDEQTSQQGSLTRQDIHRYEGYFSTDHIAGERTTVRSQVYNHYYGRNRESYSGILEEWTPGEQEYENLLAGEIYGTFDLTEQIMVVAGIEASLNTMKRDYLTLDDEEGTISRDGQALVLQSEWYGMERYSFVLGLRVERDSRYGFAAAPRLAAMYYLIPELRMIGGLGVGYRAPDFNDLYLLNNQVVAMPYAISGNPDLEPEYSFGGNWGLEYTSHSFLLQGNLFYNEMFREIIYQETGIIDGESGKEIIRTENLDRSLRTGTDIEARFQLPFSSFFSAGYSYLFAYNRTESSRMREEPAHTLRCRIGIDNKEQGWYLHLSGLYFSPLDPESEGSGEENRYRLDLNGSKSIGKHLEAVVSVENLTGYIHPTLGPYYGPQLSLGIDASF
jgi:outer membrane receptor for ferrienterochelin and colicins